MPKNKLRARPKADNIVPSTYMSCSRLGKVEVHHFVNLNNVDLAMTYAIRPSCLSVGTTALRIQNFRNVADDWVAAYF